MSRIFNQGLFISYVQPKHFSFWSLKTYEHSENHHLSLLSPTSAWKTYLSWSPPLSNTEGEKIGSTKAQLWRLIQTTKIRLPSALQACRVEHLSHLHTPIMTVHLGPRPPFNQGSGFRYFPTPTHGSHAWMSTPFHPTVLELKSSQSYTPHDQ